MNVLYFPFDFWKEEHLPSFQCLPPPHLPLVLLSANPTPTPVFLCRIVFVPLSVFIPFQQLPWCVFSWVCCSLSWLIVLYLNISKRKTYAPLEGLLLCCRGGSSDIFQTHRTECSSLVPFKHLSPVSSGTAAVRSLRPTLISSSTTVSCSTRTRRRWG